MEVEKRDNILKIERYDSQQIETRSIFIHRPMTIYRIECGTIAVQRLEESYTLKVGDCIILAENSHIKIEPLSDDCRISICELSKTFTDRIYLLLDVKVMEVIFGAEGVGYISTESNNMAINQTLDKLFELYNNFTHPLREQYIYSLIYTFLLELYKQAYKFRKSNAVGSSKYVSYSVDRFFQLCMEFHHREHATSYYAEQLGLSPRYLYKIIKNSIGQSPKQVINNHLMESSRRLLLTTTHSTQQIAEMLNFPDQSSFGQFFKRCTGLSPTEFRRRY